MKKIVETVEESNPRLAQILTISPGYIWGSGVFNTPLEINDLKDYYPYLNSELMEGQREYYRKKKEIEEMGGAAKNSEDDSKMKEKVTKLIKMRRLAKMAQVLDTSTVCYCNNPQLLAGLSYSGYELLIDSEV